MNKTLSNILKEMELRLIDLADLLQISRPTTYKFIELYEIGQRDKLSKEVLKIFDFIVENSDKTKLDVIAFVINHLRKPNLDANKKSDIVKKLVKGDDVVKANFIDRLVEVEVFDPILPYMLECEKILSAKNKKVTSNELLKLEALEKFYNSLGFKLNIKKEKNA